MDPTHSPGQASDRPPDVLEQSPPRFSFSVDLTNAELTYIDVVPYGNHGRAAIQMTLAGTVDISLRGDRHELWQNYVVALDGRFAKLHTGEHPAVVDGGGDTGGGS